MFNLVPMERRNRRLMSSFGRNFDRFFDIFDNTMSTDIIDKGDKYELTCELPGLEKEDIKISIDNNTMTIAVDQQSEREEKKKTTSCKRDVPVSIIGVLTSEASTRTRLAALTRMVYSI